MAREPLPIVGGPLDGTGTTRRDAFFEARGVVYRRAPDGYVFAGHAARRCPGCDAWLTPPPSEVRPERCPLCGANLGSS